MMLNGPKFQENVSVAFWHNGTIHENSESQTMLGMQKTGESHYLPFFSPLFYSFPFPLNVIHILLPNI